MRLREQREGGSRDLLQGEWGVSGTDNTDITALTASDLPALSPCRIGLFSPDYSTDRNFDGTFTYSDLKSVIGDFLLIPMDLFRAWTYGTDFGIFFEVSCSRSTGSSFFSALIVVALLYSIAESFSLYVERSEERQRTKERKEKGYK